MKKTWTYQRTNKPGWWVGWYESGKKRSKSLPTKAMANHFAQIKYHQLNSDVFTGIINVDWETIKKEYLYSFDVRQCTNDAKYQAELTLRHFEIIVGPISSRNITQAVVDQFIVKRSRQKDNKKKISKWTLNKDISNLRAFLNWAQDKKRRYIVPDIEVHKIKTEDKKVKPLTTEQIHNLLIAAKNFDSTWYIRILLSLGTGLRKNDTESLKIQDINFETNSIDTKSKKTGKSMIDRPLPNAIMNALTDYVNSLSNGQIKLFADTNTHKKWKKIRENAGLPNLRYQDLRVTFSSVLQQRGESLAVAQQLLEHSSPETTRKFYTSVDSSLRTAVNKLPIDDWLV